MPHHNTEIVIGLDAIGEAGEALRRSMVTLMEDENAEYAHPMFWAPFSVVGEGGRVSID
jgi:CHAT domain-containing protein